MSDLYSTTPSTIIVYSTTWCPDCHRAKKFFDKQQVSYIDVDVEQDEKGLEFIKGLNEGRRVVPTIVFPDGEILFEPATNVLREKIS